MASPVERQLRAPLPVVARLVRRTAPCWLQEAEQRWAPLPAVQPPDAAERLPAAGPRLEHQARVQPVAMSQAAPLGRRLVAHPERQALLPQAWMAPQALLTA
jgi:hypothetical protein